MWQIWETIQNGTPLLILLTIIGALAMAFEWLRRKAQRKLIASEKKVLELEVELDATNIKLRATEDKLTKAENKLTARSGHDASDLTEHCTTLQRFFGASVAPVTLREATRLTEKHEAADEGYLERLMLANDVRKDVVDKRAAGEIIKNVRHYMPTIVARFEQQRGMYAIKSADAIVARQKGTTIKDENTRLVAENAALNQSLTGQIGANAVLAETLRQVMLKFEELDGSNPLVAQYYEAKGLAEGRGATFDKVIPLFKPQSSGNRQNENRNNNGNRGGGNNNGNGNNNRGGNNPPNNDADDNQNEQTGS